MNFLESPCIMMQAISRSHKKSMQNLQIFKNFCLEFAATGNHFLNKLPQEGPSY
jgi:hypothetical protein